MMRKTKLLKAVAIFFVLNTLQAAFWPSIALALTSGPTAPEYIGFEPVDTTDMVSMSSGDFTYNIPLLEVPGPEGGYPLGLSYHAGISPSEDASWVGLGWTLNPGAISRFVSGFPDDHNGQENPEAVQRVDDDWEGGTRHTATLGVGMGGFTYANLTGSWDTYAGFSGGLSAGVGIRGVVGVSASAMYHTQDQSVSGSVGLIGNLGPLRGNLSATWSTSSSGLGVSAGIVAGASAGKFASVSLAQSASYSQGKFSTSTSVGFQAAVGTGSSMGSGSKNPSYGIGASIPVGSNNAGKMSTQSFGGQVTIPGILGPADLIVGYQYQRYWIDETNSVKVLGSLNPVGTSNAGFDATNSSYDSYLIPDPTSPSILDENHRPELARGGSFSAYDSYQVLAQGIGGGIAPHSYRNTVTWRQNLDNPADENELRERYFATNIQQADRKLSFRFLNDFSNYFYWDYTGGSQVAGDGTIPHINSATEAVYGIGLLDLSVGETTVDFNQSYTTSIGEDISGFSVTNQMLAGSQHVEYFTVDEIRNPAVNKNGLITPVPYQNFSKVVEKPNGTDDVSQQIGGFMVTNESGITYHFTQPVYAYNEYSNMENTTQGLYTQESYKQHAYAYTWLLTAVTGADWVSQATTFDGTLTDNDFGYWVKLSHGKWTNNYKWRTPEDDKYQDINPDTEFWTRGEKELYYLNYIRTRSHTALFSKVIRHDGKGLTDAGGDPHFISGNVTVSCEVDPQSEDPANTYIESQQPVSPLRLSDIYLVPNEKLDGLIANTSGVASVDDILGLGNNVRYHTQNTIYSGTSCTGVASKGHLGQNVLDVFDILAMDENALIQQSFRMITLHHDYSLSPFTPNSFDPVSPQELMGKLTLRSIETRGIQGQKVIPATGFSYEREGGESTIHHIGNATIEYAGGQSLEVGDILWRRDTKQYLLVEDQIGISNQYRVKKLGDHTDPLSQGNNITVVHTSNPPYEREARDWWGNYKSDFEAIPGVNENISRAPSYVARKGLEAWSLQQVYTPLGALLEVTYEPNDYRDVVLTRAPYPLKISNVARTGSNQEIVITFQNNQPNGRNYFEVGDKLNFLGVFEHGIVKSGVPPECLAPADPDNWDFEKVENFRNFQGLPVVAVSPNSITVQSLVFDGFLENTVRNQNADGSDVTDFCTLNNIPPAGMVYGNAGVELIASKPKQGAGIRVASIGVKDAMTGLTNTTHYHYDQGTLPYEPIKLDVDDQIRGYNGPNASPADLAFYNAILNSGVSELIVFSHKLPPPSVTYGTVSITGSTTHPDGNTFTLPSRSEYNYQVFTQDMITWDQAYDNTAGNVDYRTVVVRDYTARLGNLLGMKEYGTLRVEDEQQGNEEEVLLAETDFQYLYEDGGDFQATLESNFRNQGVVHQMSTEMRKVITGVDGQGHSEYNTLATLSLEERYPAIQYKTTVSNPRNGVQNSQYTLAYDLYTGSVTHSLAEDGYGVQLLSVSKPAYWLYPNDNTYGGMGLKIHNPLNKHMLTQQAYSAKLKVQMSDALENLTGPIGPAEYPVVNYYDLNEAGTNVIGVLSADIQTWGDTHAVLNEGLQRGNWRQAERYTYLGTDSHKQADGSMSWLGFKEALTNFNALPTSGSGWDMDQRAAVVGWQFLGEGSLYDPYSHLIESEDYLGFKSATHMDPDYSRVLATSGLAGYHEFMHYGAEFTTQPHDNLTVLAATKTMTESGSGGASAFRAHTGQSLLFMPANRTGNKVLTYQNAPGEMRSDQPFMAMVWVLANNGLNDNTKLTYSWQQAGTQGEVLGTQIASSSGDWQLLKLTIPPSTQAQDVLTVELLCEDLAQYAMIDDFRVHPVASGITSYVYDSWGRLSFLIDATNHYARFEYDAMGGLIASYAEYPNASADPTNDRRTGERKVSTSEKEYARGLNN